MCHLGGIFLNDDRWSNEPPRKPRKECKTGAEVTGVVWWWLMLESGSEVGEVISARIVAVSVPCLRWVLRVQHCWVLIVIKTIKIGQSGGK